MFDKWVLGWFLSWLFDGEKGLKNMFSCLLTIEHSRIQIWVKVEGHEF